MDNDKVSPTGIILTFLLHCVLYYLLTTNFQHPAPHIVPYNTIAVSIAATRELHPPEEKTPLAADLLVPKEVIMAAGEDHMPDENNRYYLPQELSQQVHVLIDDTANLHVPIRKIVTLNIYINEAGDVDDVTIDDKGDMTPEEEEKLINGFKNIVFLPGMRGAKIVKSLYRVKLAINSRLTFIR